MRAIRQQKDMTLQDVEDESDGTWKAVVVGAYERADRSVSATKLAGLASFYGVPVTAFLPAAAHTAHRVSSHLERGVVLDLTGLADTTLHPAARPIKRLATTIQRQRGDYNGRVLTLRADDLRALAVVYGVTPDELVEKLDEEGVLTNQGR